MTDETRARAKALQQSRPSIPDLLDGYCVHGRTIAHDNGGEDKIAASDCQECIALFVAELARLEAERDAALFRLASEQEAGEQVQCERDEARAFGERVAREYNAVIAGEPVLRCAFCDAAYPPGTPGTQHANLTEHVMICTAHPLRACMVELEAALAREQARLDEIEAIVRDFSEDDGADPIVGKVQELFDCERETSGDFIRSEEARWVAVEALRDLLGNMGIEQDDPRISYVTVQLPRESIADARAALDAQPEESTS